MILKKAAQSQVTSVIRDAPRPKRLMAICRSESFSQNQLTHIRTDWLTAISEGFGVFGECQQQEVNDRSHGDRENPFNDEHPLP